jgi:hypothetical protein
MGCFACIKPYFLGSLEKGMRTFDIGFKKGIWAVD